MKYGFVVMVWKTSLVRGILMLIFFIAQIIVDMSGYLPNSKERIFKAQ